MDSFLFLLHTGIHYTPGEAQNSNSKTEYGLHLKEESRFLLLFKVLTIIKVILVYGGIIFSHCPETQPYQ